jgi:hypothetical protein
MHNKTKQELIKIIDELKQRFEIYQQISTEAVWRIDVKPPLSLALPEDEQIRHIFAHSIVTNANDTMAMNYAYTNAKNFIGTPLREILPPQEPSSIETIHVLIQNRFSFTNLFTLERSKTGKRLAFLNNLQPNIKNNHLHFVRGTSGEITELYEQREVLQEQKKLLDQQKRTLEKKNLARQEIVSQVKMDEKAFQDKIMANLENIIFPLLDKIELKKGTETLVTQLRQALMNLTGSFGQKISSTAIKQTPREIEICNLAKNGLPNKEIAQLLNLSVHTVERHRRMTRKKLGLTNNKINLYAYLKSQ